MKIIIINHNKLLCFFSFNFILICLIYFIVTVYFYNFAWKDYGDATTSKILDMVKVVAFSIQEGRVAIHCHAGNLIIINNL